MIKKKDIVCDFCKMTVGIFSEFVQLKLVRFDQTWKVSLTSLAFVVSRHIKDESYEKIFLP